MPIDAKTGRFYTTVKQLKVALDLLPEDWEIECHPRLKDMALLAQNDDGSEWATVKMVNGAIDRHYKDGRYEYLEDHVEEITEDQG